MKNFDEYISSSFSTDYWADEGIGISEEKLSHFSTEDWNELNHTIKNRDKAWLIRCAEILGDHEDTKSLRVLMNLHNIVNEIDQSSIIVKTMLDSLKKKLV